MLPDIYSDDDLAPSTSGVALHISFPDSAVIEYEPETRTLTMSGIKTASVTASEPVVVTVPVVTMKASQKITLDTPEVIWTNKLITSTLEVQKGGRISCDIEHNWSNFKFNGVQVDNYKHGGVERGGSWPEGTQ